MSTNNNIPLKNKNPSMRLVEINNKCFNIDNKIINN